MAIESRDRHFAAEVLHDVVHQWRDMIEIESAMDAKDLRLIEPGDLIWWHYAPERRYSDEVRVPAVVVKVSVLKVTIEFERVERGEVVRQRKTVAMKKISHR